MARWVVGIDLGTTNTVVAAADLERDAPGELVLRIEQRVDAGTVDARQLLPSALYAPTDAERRHDDPAWIVGEWARRRGAEVPSRSVLSAKSWLAHAGVDRTAAILPWGVDEEGEQPKISPVDASARVLAHVRDAWDRAHPDAPFVEQQIVLTVPASFDESARALTVEATRRAGIPEGSLRLLEEPQAAFLDWARVVGEGGLRALVGDDAAPREVLVCDVGGGTTDLSLIRARKDDSPIGVALERVAVGDHLLLGGDNVDLALAHLLEPRLSGSGPKLAPSRFAQLVVAAREAKEKLLSSKQTLSETTVTLLGGGSKLIGGSQRATLTREEVERVLDGFLPLVDRDSRPMRARAGLVAFGLPYASDPAITRHLAQFLARHSLHGARAMALLLNGGAFHAQPIVERVVRAVEALTGVAPELLQQGDPDLSVARGAVAYGLSLHGRGVRIGSGSSRSYWIGLDRQRAVCVVPRGARAGERNVVQGRSFALTLGRSARFDLFASSGDGQHVDGTGDVAVVDQREDFVPLPPVLTAVASGEKGDVMVRLEGELTEVGTLDLECVEVESGRRHRLGFEIRREALPARDIKPRSQRPASVGPKDEKRLAEARDKIERVFGKAVADADPREAKGLMRELERILGERTTWPTTIVRPLFDVLRPGIPNRKRSPDHERVFFQLAGFLLRPGFGDPLDPQRVAAMVPLWEQRLVNGNDVNGWRAYWIAWRRIAGGLGEPVQTRIRDTLDPFLAPEEGRPRKKPKGVRGEPLDEVIYLASSLERVPAQRRAELGTWILERTWTSQDPGLYSAIGRLGARAPAYASAHHVVSARTAETWLAHVLRADWRAMPTASFAAVQLARFTGDRARDVSESVREEVAKQLERTGAHADWIRLVREVVALDEDQRREAFGEALPPGLRLVE